MANFTDYFDMAKVNSMVNKVKNVVMQYSEWEGKVREATNNDPWGTASTTQMEIANGKWLIDCSYVSLEIMSTIYKRLQEPPSSTWRQTYKGLQLLEFLLKNGSEQHAKTITTLMTKRKIKELTVNTINSVRHRAKEIVDMLGNDDKIRDERQKAKENRNKYKGVSSYEMKSGGGYSGFGSDSYSSDRRGVGSDSYSSDNYRSGGFRDSASRYDEQSNRYDEPTNYSKPAPKIEKTAPIEKKVEAKPVVKDLLDMGNDNDWSDFNTAPAQNDFATFQSAAAIPPKSNDFEFTDFVGATKPPTATNAGFANFATAKISPGTNAPNAQDFSNFPTASTGNQGFGFANFTQPTAPNQNFANFVSPNAAPANQGFANFTAVPSSNNQGFANFTAAPVSNNQQFGAFATSPAKNDGFANFSNVQTTPKSEFGGFAQAPAAANDPISKLVSLDAFSLVSTGKKDNGTAPSLNSLGTPNKSGF
ncbi:Epsin-3, clathrin recruitment and traffic between the Golgi and endosome [Terramyces sp. JEL0728]|nr:Epsin-3, clathrin recruitment and traffic between the Golgi and endosome [Terramyces sp. JEL0728]